MRGQADISIGNLLAAALGGVAAALVLSYFGAAGSLVGAALGPVVYLLVKELSRPPTESALARAGRSRRPGDPPEPLPVGAAPPAPLRRPARRRGLAWILATAAVATLAAVALITVPELISGRSLTGGDRSTTLFDPGGGSGGAGVTIVTEPATESPADPADESPTVTEAPATDPEAPVTESPVTEAPATDPEAPVTEEAPVTGSAPAEPAPQAEVVPAEPASGESSSP